MSHRPGKRVTCKPPGVQIPPLPPASPAACPISSVTRRPSPSGENWETILYVWARRTTSELTHTNALTCCSGGFRRSDEQPYLVRDEGRRSGGVGDQARVDSGGSLVDVVVGLVAGCGLGVKTGYVAGVVGVQRDGDTEQVLAQRWERVELVAVLVAVCSSRHGYGRTSSNRRRSLPPAPRYVRCITCLSDFPAKGPAISLTAGPLLQRSEAKVRCPQPWRDRPRARARRLRRARPGSRCRQPTRRSRSRRPRPLLPSPRRSRRRWHRVGRSACRSSP